MLPYLALGLALVVIVHLSLKAFVKAKPENIRKASRAFIWVAFIIAAILLLRLGLVHYAAVTAFIGAVIAFAGRASTLWVIWKRFTGGQQTMREPAKQRMSKEEARKILGVAVNASHQEIQEAYRRQIRNNHPDKGGSEYLASQINLARDTLLD
ncbi:MAG: hypothetical protein FJX23_10655 [Alphaproteobacteria bacterium]|nr:hypothetical protein [Alphaproteobacteria bacterium]